MNSWLTYLKDKIIEQINDIMKLIMIDNHIQGSNYDINKLMRFINLNIDKKCFIKRVVPKDAYYIIEGNSESLIIALNDTMDVATQITVLENNLALNKWIIKQYNNFCSQNGIKENVVVISDYYEYHDCNLIAIGSQAFINEVHECNNVPLFSFVDE